MNTAHRKFIDRKRKYIMLSNSNNAKRKLLRNMKEAHGSGSDK